ncbi:MAG: hypothetical protein J6N52_02045 [Clostridia bacterium]|nr:hypothetical protein [Clostridia bacterium]
MKDIAGCDYKDYLPLPILEGCPEFGEFYKKAWEIAYAHIKDIENMPQTPYMDEAFCDTQIWIWDSCFMSLFCKYAREVFPGVETLNNFYEVLYNNKKLPMVIPTEKEPAWTGAVPNEPYEMLVHIADNPPLFAWAEYENAMFSGDLEYLKELLYKKQFLQKHYEWLENLKEKTTPRSVREQTCWIAEEKGYRWEGGRSGMDNTPRGRTTPSAAEERPNNPDMLWIDAVCQQALSAKMISRLFDIVNDKELSQLWAEKYSQKKEIINRFYWDEEDKFYYDIDCKTNDFYKVMTIASYWTLTAGVASKEQAEALAKHVLNPNTFGGKVPLVSLSRSDNDFNRSGKYWRGSLWLPTAYAALKGLKEYGLFDIAHSAAESVLKHMCNTFYQYEPHTIWECYSPEEYKPSTGTNGKKIVRPDFCGWSALGPISIYIEFVLGFHTVNAFENIVEWEKPKNVKGKIGIKNLRFGSVITDIIAEGDECRCYSNADFTLKINGKSYSIANGENIIRIDGLR